MDGTSPQENALQLQLLQKINESLITSVQERLPGMLTFPWSTEQYFRDDRWAIPLLATSAANVISVMVFEVIVVVKAFQGTPSRRHFFLGQCLLGGLVMMSISAFTFALEPTYFSCSSSRALIGVSPAIVFGSLLVKCVFLISLHSGVYLPAYYQGLLLFFIVLVQGAITIQWMATEPTRTKLSEMDSVNEVYWTCESSYKNYVLSLMYVMVLVLMVAVFSIKCRRVRENYRESSYIGFTMCVMVPLWLVWVLTGFALSTRVQPACLGFGYTVSATIIFLVMFIPKGRQMVAIGEDGIYSEDRASSLSSSSDDKYSPSFVMFQPVKSSKQVLMSSRKDGFSIFKTDASAGSIHLPGSEEGIYTSINPKEDSGILTNPNFYLFSSHSNLEMMY